MDRDPEVTRFVPGPWHDPDRQRIVRDDALRPHGPPERGKALQMTCTDRADGVKRTLAEALEIACAIILSRYRGAVYAFVAGSIPRGEGTRFSDLDIVIVYDRLEAARRESFVVDGCPVEAFVHDEETLAWFVDADMARGRPSILNMVAEGKIIGPAPERGKVMQAHIARRLSEGAPGMENTHRDILRYEITDAIDDLRGERGPGEIMAIGTMLYPRLVELALRGRGHWNGAGKWAPRLLAAADAGLAGQFDRAFRALFGSGICEPVIALAERELEPHGGPLFDGDCRQAPSSWRVRGGIGSGQTSLR
ncbi:nucleotidyltransferase domain-containing protein [Gluconacetobacter sacchari]|nr:nucleotidyltransferase domain-containing protein [Gluconacetobacter sacchari]